jgi:plastocyanin
MKRHAENVQTFAGILAMVLFLAVKSDYATTHMVQFGGSLGLAYSPSNFSAKVGDTVKWEGDFSIHPLSSTTIPANAVSWQMGSGSSFIYVITVPGTYNYHCDIHFSLGMTGSFTASDASVWQNGLFTKTGRTNHVMFVDASSHGNPSISFFVPSAGLVTLEVFDLLGHKVATPVNQIKAAGTYEVFLKSEIPVHGLYFLKLAGDGEEVIRTLRVVN